MKSTFDWRGPSSMRDAIVKIGRPPESLLSDEERAQRHRAAALRHYHRAKARRAECFFAAAGDREALD